MSVTAEDAARAALRRQQGPGARYDSPSAPAHELLWARRGTAYFARKLGELPDAELDRPSLLPGWSRRHVIAHVGYNARALTRLLAWARTGTEAPMYSSQRQRGAEIEAGVSLPARALRSLFAHAATHLDVEWRDLPDPAWDAEIRTAQGRWVPARETAWMRVREVWLHAVDLDNGGNLRDFPVDLLDELLADVLRAWQRRQESVHLVVSAPDRPPIVLGDGGLTVSGAVPDLVSWLTGRGKVGVIAESDELPTIPRWL